MLSTLCRFPAYVSLSRFRIEVDSSCICCRTKLAPIKPAPPVTRIVFRISNSRWKRWNIPPCLRARRDLIVIKKGRGLAPPALFLSELSRRYTTGIAGAPGFCCLQYAPQVVNYRGDTHHSRNRSFSYSLL